MFSNGKTRGGGFASHCRFGAVIVKNKQIHEVYGTNGEPLASMWYKPEAPLTWNAGMFIYACKFFEEAKLHASKLIHTDT